MTFITCAVQVHISVVCKAAGWRRCGAREGGGGAGCRRALCAGGRGATCLEELEELHLHQGQHSSGGGGAWHSCAQDVAAAPRADAKSPEAQGILLHTPVCPSASACRPVWDGTST